MKLWILRPVAGLPKTDDPWEPWYDKAFGFVVRAETVEQARTLAQAEGGDERRKDISPWLNEKYTTCEPLTDAGNSEVIIRDFAAA